jgi:lipopolysaccharide/colanic/teichoic acid biosynthesis glycosyltransferase
MCLHRWIGGVNSVNSEAVKSDEQPCVRNKPGRLFFVVKRIADILISAVSLIVLSPLFLVVSILIKVEDGGSVIHTRYCVGKNEKLYKMYKFRTMHIDADDLEKHLSEEQLEQYKKEIKLYNDPRITKIGAKLRKYSIDELPQLLSVFESSMSIIGPRPMTVEESYHFGSNRNIILDIKPGITGYWQTNGRGRCTYESGKRQELEMYYANHRSFSMDIGILFKTVAVVINGEGAQ